MADEIERKYLVKKESVLPLLQEGTLFSQGYLADNERLSARVRLAGEKAWMTVKGRGSGITRPEFEYEIPAADARYILENLCAGLLISKTRYRVPYKGMTWEVDVFEGENSGLIVAEVELEDDQQRPELPPWVAEEVTADRRYLNVSLSSHPFSRWSDTE
jgi:adenylate cyclase